VAVARAQCLYCGAPLGEAQVAAARVAAQELEEAPAAPAAGRHLVVLAADGAAVEVLAAALALSSFEAGQRVRRGGYQLHRIAAPEAAATEAARLRAAGLAVEVVPEAEARAAERPWMVMGGAWAGEVAALRGEDGGTREVSPAALLLVVRGPIARATEGVPQIKRVRLAFPQEGQRVHLHLRGEAQPLEVDPEAFEMGGGAGAATARMSGWLRSLAGQVPVDDGFARLAPALSPAAAVTGGAAAAARALSEGQARARPAALQLDNVAQFRFYSGWRAAVERRRGAGRPG
jgi:hypothetical protein